MGTKDFIYRGFCVLIAMVGQGNCDSNSFFSNTNYLNLVESLNTAFNSRRNYEGAWAISTTQSTNSNTARPNRSPISTAHGTYEPFAAH